VQRAKGVLLRYTGRVEEAVECYAEAIAVFRMLGARRSEARAKVSLAFAMYVMERYEDTIALGLEAVAIDQSMGGRFQIAKTFSNVGQAYARIGDLGRGLAFLRRAREAHERFADQDSRTDTLLVTASVLLEAGDLDAAHTLCLDAGALTAVTGSIYDVIHEHIVRALLARHTGDAQRAIDHASQARQLAESQAMMSFHLYATAIEAAARVDAGELHTGVLLARTALGAVEATTSEYGIEVRALGCEALRRASPIAAEDAYQRAAAHVRKVASWIRVPEHRDAFFSRAVVERILFEAGGAEAGSKPPPPLAGASAPPPRGAS
jgi:tetratricopeptide (TPR) repeat protein